MPPLPNFIFIPWSLSSAGPHRSATQAQLAANSPDTRYHCGSRLHDPFNAGHAQEAFRSEMSFDPDGCGSEITVRATFGVRTHA